MQPPFLRPATPKKPGLWRRTPPVLFTPIFGLFGLGLAWQRAQGAFQMPGWPSEVIFGAVSLLFVFVLVAYLTKVLRRPTVVGEDLRILPGRAGLAALSLSGMLMAAGLIPFSTALAAAILGLAILIHAVVLILVVWALVTGPSEARVVTPVWHLTFVGFIVSPLAAIPLGWTQWSEGVFWVSLVFAVVIWGVSVAQILRRDVPAPLRPLLALHLAPASVLGSVAMLLGYTTIAFGLGVFSTALLAALVIRARWVTEAGFSPLWGAFTFPLAAFAALMLLLAAGGLGAPFRYFGGLALVAATLMIPVIMWKVIQMWSKGVLAVKTNAAEA